MEHIYRLDCTIGDVAKFVDEIHAPNDRFASLDLFYVITEDNVTEFVHYTLASTIQEVRSVDQAECRKSIYNYNSTAFTLEPIVLDKLISSEEFYGRLSDFPPDLILSTMQIEAKIAGNTYRFDFTDEIGLRSVSFDVAPNTARSQLGRMMSGKLDSYADQQTVIQRIMGS